MRLAYLDACAGVSGDMLLGAFIQAGAPVETLRKTLACLNLGATLRVEEVDRSGIHAFKVHIEVDGHAADAPARAHAYEHGHEHAHGHGHEHSHTHTGEQKQEQPSRQRRSLAGIRVLINDAPLPPGVRSRAIRAFELLGEAEAKIHHVPLESIHFHEVGAVDAIADIVLACAAADALRLEAWVCSPLNVGGGTVQCAHGRFPVPAPATAELLRGAPTYSSGIEAELVTPTGAALLRAFEATFGPQPSMKAQSIGYGAGTRNPPGFANVVRLTIGESMEPAGQVNDTRETVLVLEAAIDDLNPQILAYVTEQALKLGALDVMCTPVFMKKNRSGTLLTILSDHAHAPALETLLLHETSTLGLRIHEERRVCLQRRHVPVDTPWGSVRMKVGFREQEEFNASPEFEDCRALAEEHGIPVKRVLETAQQAYRKDHP